MYRFQKCDSEFTQENFAKKPTPATPTPGIGPTLMSLGSASVETWTMFQNSSLASPPERPPMAKPEGNCIK